MTAQYYSFEFICEGKTSDGCPCLMGYRYVHQTEEQARRFDLQS